MFLDCSNYTEELRELHSNETVTEVSQSDISYDPFLEACAKIDYG